MRFSALLPVIGVLASYGSSALAQDASASADLSGVDASSDAGYELGDDPFEIGVFGGGMWLEGREAKPALGRRLDAPEFDSVGWEVGARLGLYPIKYLGIEGEVAAIGSDASDDSSAFIGTARGQLVGQLPLGIVAPFILAGAGVIGAECPAGGCESKTGGRDTEAAFHFGVGAKLGLFRYFHVRLDARDTIAGGDHLPEALLTLGLNFGHTEEEPPPPAPKDTDGDGKTDDVDKCPMEPASTPDGCPIGDRDGDGKTDDVDKCPDEPSDLPDGCPDPDPDKDGIEGEADKCPDVAGIAPDGCPDPDPDKDGIKGEADKCPNEPETVNSFDDADGCPDTMPDKVQRFNGVVSGIEFDTGKATIRPASFGVLDEAVAVLKEYPGVELKITGHTDSQGSAERNRTLSLARANAVADYLASKGIERDRLTTEGLGPDKPIADNKTKDGRQKNRRIEFEVVQ